MSYFYNLVALKKITISERICVMITYKLNLQNVLTF